MILQTMISDNKMFFCPIVWLLEYDLFFKPIIQQTGGFVKSMTIFKHKGLNICNHNFVLYSPWMMSLLSETVPSDFRVPLELITVALLVLVLSVTTWSPPGTFFNIPGRHDSSVSPSKINTNICKNLSNFTDNCCTTNFNE